VSSSSIPLIHAAGWSCSWLVLTPLSFFSSLPADPSLFPSQGILDIMSQKERVVRFSEETRRRDRDSLFYAPPGGESLVHVLSRVDGVLTNFNRQCANRGAIVVCHGEVMWAFRLRFERLSQLTYREMEVRHSGHPTALHALTHAMHSADA